MAAFVSARAKALSAWRARCVVLAAAALVAGCGAPGAGRPAAAAAEGASPSASLEFAPRRLELAPGAVLGGACVTTGPELCFNARDDNCNGILDEGCGLGTGLVQVMLAWSGDANLDLVVLDPTGVEVQAGVVSATGLTKEHDCPADCFQQNVENVHSVGEQAPPPGEYRVRVRVTALEGEPAPIHVVLGARIGAKSYAAELDIDDQGDELVLLFEL